MGMDKRIVPVLLAAALGLAACGSDSDSTAAGDSLPPVVDGYQHPTGADDVVIEYAEVGGFMPRDFAFRQTPNVLISGDGRSFSPGAQIEIYPGPLLPAVQVWSIGEDGIQEALAAADEAGLLQDDRLRAADEHRRRLDRAGDDQRQRRHLRPLGIRTRSSEAARVTTAPTQPRPSVRRCSTSSTS